MDNAPIHKEFPSIEQLVDVLVYLPPYSPELNACEYCFSQLKAHLPKIIQTQHTGREWEDVCGAAINSLLPTINTSLLYERVWKLMQCVVDCKGSMREANKLYNSTTD
eukprot:UN07776